MKKNLAKKLAIVSVTILSIALIMLGIYFIMDKTISITKININNANKSAATVASGTNPSNYTWNVTNVSSFVCRSDDDGCCYGISRHYLPKDKNKGSSQQFYCVYEGAILNYNGDGMKFTRIGSGMSNLPPAIAYVVSNYNPHIWIGDTDWEYDSNDDLITYTVLNSSSGNWSALEQVSIWDLRGTGYDGGINSGSTRTSPYRLFRNTTERNQFNAESSILTWSSKKYADYEAKINKNGSNITQKETTVTNDQTADKITIGPFKTEYVTGSYSTTINDETNRVTFSGISNIQLVCYNSSNENVKEINMNKALLYNSTNKTYEEKTLDYFTPNTNTKVDTTAQAYPSSNQSFKLRINNPNKGVTNTSEIVTKIKVLVTYKYMLAQGKYVKYNGTRRHKRRSRCDFLRWN